MAPLIEKAVETAVVAAAGAAAKHVAEHPEDVMDVLVVKPVEAFGDAFCAVCKKGEDFIDWLSFH